MSVKLLKFCGISRYRYALDELYPMMNALKLRAESYNEWASNVNDALEAKVNNKKSTYLIIICFLPLKIMKLVASFYSCSFRSSSHLLQWGFNVQRTAAKTDKMI